MRFALFNGNLQDWLPGVAGTDPRLGYRFWGVNYEKGACTSPLFHFLRDNLSFWHVFPSSRVGRQSHPQASPRALPARAPAGISRVLPESMEMGSGGKKKY